MDFFLLVPALLLLWLVVLVAGCGGGAWEGGVLCCWALPEMDKAASKQGPVFGEINSIITIIIITLKTGHWEE